MPRPWDKVISQRPPVLEAARSWYDKWIRGERHGAGNGADLHDKPQAEAPGEKAVQDDTPLEAYAESLKTDTVAEEVEQSVRDVASRLDALEFAGMAQAETLKNLTEQDQTLTRQLAELRSGMREVEQQLQEARARTEEQRASLESIDARMLQLSGDLSRLAARIRSAFWVAGIGIAAAIAAIVLAVAR